MAFFLLGRVDDTLRLLCPDTFSSRQEALAALSSVTAEPGFDLWDAEVLLLETDSGTPVLLVRPQIVTVEAAVDVEAPVIDELDEEPLETVVTDEVEIEVATAEVSPTDIGPLGEADAGDEEPIVVADDDPATEVRVEVGSESIPTVEVDVAPEPMVAVEDDAITDAIMEDLEAEEQSAAGALREALARTTAQMEADGIVAPESIGAPASDAPDSDAAPTVDKEWPWDVATEPEPLIAPEIAFVLGELEEPSLDDGSILRGSIDDDTFAAARPVIMGSYAEPRDASPSEVLPADDLPVEPMGLTELAPAAAPLPGPSGFAVPVVSDASDIIELEPPVEEETDSPVSDSSEALPVDDEDPADRDISDFILDLDTPHVPETVTEPAEEIVGQTPGVFDDMPGVVENTCDDCVYEDTCPNRDQRLPKDCGSFSWR